MGPVWHTASGNGGRPLALALSSPAGVGQAPLLNREDGEIDVSLLNVVNIAGFFQCLDHEFPPAMVMNLYFDGDNLTPGISATIAANAAPSAFLMSRSSRTISLDLADTESLPALLFDNGTFQVALSAAFFFSSTGLPNPWRTKLFENLDRVGMDKFAPDGLADGVVVFTLNVGPSPTPPAPLQTRQRLQIAPAPVPAARVGEDSWVGPTPNEPLAAPSPPLATPAAELSDSEGTPMVARTAEGDRTPTMPTTGSVTPSAGVRSTATPLQTRSPQTTPGTPTPAAATPRSRDAEPLQE